jgi:GMP synthase (glutamine-hydrolysing)
MKILLIDNGSSFLDKLSELIPGQEIICKWDNISDVKTEDFDLIILSGGHNFEIEGNEKRLEKELNLIRNTKKPLIGICYGCELIAKAFGGKLEKSLEKHKGIIDILFTKGNSLFSAEKIKVYENHSWIIKTLPTDFVSLAHSEHGPEIIKHKDLSIYGFQFHPEKCIEETEGDEVFLSVLDSLIFR